MPRLSELDASLPTPNRSVAECAHPVASGQRSTRLSCLTAFLWFGFAWVTVYDASCQEDGGRPRRPVEDNPVAALFVQVGRGEATLRHDRHFGYLKSLLAAWDIPVSSQSLVYAKTSLQAGRISPSNPRAIYFNDDVYVAWVRGSSLLEVATTDPDDGAAFYSVQMQPSRPVVRREGNRCLACHDLKMTQGVPGHLVRSVMTRSSGVINSLTRSYVTDHSSPFSERWGGWYVTGTLGGMQHMGNAFLEDEELVPFGAADRLDLSADIDPDGWLSLHSDVVALMVLEHQTQMHNLLVRTNRTVREALQADAGSAQPDSVLGSGQGPGRLGAEQRNSEVQKIVREAAREILHYALFSEEALLDQPIVGSSSFAADFASRGPWDSRGRSLREFDLQRRLFRYPCSYVIHSAAFNRLHPALRESVLSQLFNALGTNPSEELAAHLKPQQRQAIREIIRATVADLPAVWHVDDEEG